MALDWLIATLAWTADRERDDEAEEASRLSVQIAEHSDAINAAMERYVRSKDPSRVVGATN
jgi:hypothetical protein